MNLETDREKKAAASAPERITETGQGRRIASSELFQGCSRVIIEHEGSDYTLLITRNGKLILNK